MSTQTTDAAIKDIVDKLAAEYAPQRVVLFGSRAIGAEGQDSDVDLLIIKDTAEKFIERWKTVRRILADRNRTFALETLVLTPKEVAERLAVGDQFVANILKHGRVLYDT